MNTDAQNSSDAAQAAGHDCMDHPVHEYFEGINGDLQDSYVCGVCGNLLQVG